MEKYKRIIIPVVIFGGLLAIALLIRANPPESEPRPAPQESAMAVTTQLLDRRDFQVQLQSYGTVQPRTQTTLTAQVSGQIVYVNPNVRDGGFFEKGDTLASIDARDYEANNKIAEAVLMDAHQVLADAEARSEQAREDWASLGREGEPPALVLQLPQLEAARAKVISAEATLEKARLELERTNIIAPYAGRVLRKNVGIGQVVSVNTAIADIYATDYVEIRLPIKNRDLAYIDLPETFRDKTVTEHQIEAEVVSNLVGESNWQARVVRTEGAIDSTARQLHVIAQIDDPFSRATTGHTPLKIGQYVTAQLTGSTLKDVLVIPNAAIYQGSYVYIAENEILQRRDIEIAWQNEFEAIVSSGLNEGEKLVTTPLGQVTSGVRVTTMDNAAENGSSRSNNVSPAANTREQK